MFPTHSHGPAIRPFSSLLPSDFQLYIFHVRGRHAHKEHGVYVVSILFYFCRFWGHFLGDTRATRKFLNRGDKTILVVFCAIFSLPPNPFVLYVWALPPFTSEILMQTPELFPYVRLLSFDVDVGFCGRKRGRGCTKVLVCDCVTR